MAREAHALKMDGLNRELEEVKVANRRLQDDLVIAEERLCGVQEENSTLRQEVQHLKQLYEQLLRGTAEAEAEANPATERCAALEAQVTQLYTEVQLGAAELEEKGAQICELNDALTLAQEESESARHNCQQLGTDLGALEAELQQLQQEAELLRYRAVVEETRKWEAREARLVRQLEEMERRCQMSVTGVTTTSGSSIIPSSAGEVVATSSPGSTATAVTASTTSVVASQPATMTLSSDKSVTTVKSESVLSPQAVPFVPPPSALLPVVSGATATTTASAGPVPSTSTAAGSVLEPLAQSLLAQQMPPLPKFTGDTVGDDEEGIREWLERLEMVSSACGWSGEVKLVNLITRLRGSAYSFYRSCTPQQRSSYEQLKEGLVKRFTPVHLRSVKSSQFHERKQQQNETVDSYAQELKRLFFKAYPTTQQGSPEAEAMGRSVLSSQFIAGLRSNIKSKVAGVEGDFDELLVKARFEEARFRDFTPSTNTKHTLGSTNHPTTNHSRSFHSRKAESSDSKGKMPPGAQKPKTGCYSCGSNSHLIRNCPQRGRGAPVEARGKASTPGVVGAVAQPGDTQGKKAPSKPDDQREEVVDAELSRVAATLHGVNAVVQSHGTRLGKTPLTEVQVEGTPVRAMIDTGSPVTIISLECLLQVLAGRKSAEQSPEEWKKEVKQRLKPPTVVLRSYGGGDLDILNQIQCPISRGSYSVEGVLQVQKNAPVDLLLGTDLQPHLGFALFELNGANFVNLLPLQTESSEVSAGSGLESQQSPQESSDSEAHVADVSPELPGSNDSPTTSGEESEERQVATVCLVKAVRVPGQHAKLVKAQVDHIDLKESAIALFEPDSGLKARGISMVDAAVHPVPDEALTLLIENPGNLPVRLKKGQVLGRLEPASLVECSTQQDGDDNVVVTEQSNTQEMGAILTTPSDVCPERQQELLSLLKLDEVDLSDQDKMQLQELLLQFADTFALDDTELGSTNRVTHTIDTGDHPPIRQQPRRIPFALRRKLQTMVEDMLQRRVIKPSNSPWSSPVVLVSKKDGDIRFCVDYRKVNAVTKMDAYPLPRIDDALDMLSQVRFFTTLDLAAGFWQVKMSEDSAEKTAFCTIGGLYEFIVMPFGLCNAPATFQRLMEAVLAGLIPDKCLLYIDDILVIGRTFEDHLHNLLDVLTRLKEAELRLRPRKCRLVRKEVEYLGYLVSEKGIAAEQKKIAAVKDFQTPADLKSLKSFLGLASYYRRFIPCFSNVAHPLYVLTRKNTPFVWSNDCEKAFNSLKDLLTSAPILAYPNFEKEFYLETDASGVGLGALLTQEQDDGSMRPIAFASRSLQAHERNYGVTELEALGVVWAVKHFRPYLYGHRCTVYTDHEALKSLLNTPHPSGKLARWGMAVQELDLHIVYRPGKANTRADALSRYPLQADGSSTTMPFTLVASVVTPDVAAKDGDPLAKRQRSDPALMEIITYLETGVLPEDKHRARELVLGKTQYTVLDDVLYRVERDKTLRVIPPKSDRENLFKSVHEGTFGGHLRDAKIHGQLSCHYWWPGMRKDIRNWCLSCIPCATRSVGRQVHPPLTPIPVAGPFDRVGVDIIQFPKSQLGNRYAIVFVDYLTKWPEVFPMPDQTAPTIARLFVEEIICRHGVPGELLSDRGTGFLSKLMLEVCHLMGTKKVNTTAYHPQTDGLVERFNRTLTNMLAKTVDRGGNNWDEKLPYVLFAYRSSPQQSTGESPFFLLYGRDASLPTQEVMQPVPTRYPFSVDDYRSELVQSMSTAWDIARSSIVKAQSRQKKLHDQKAGGADFVVGDRVFVYMPAAKSSKAYKFAKPFEGPYRILATYDNGADVYLIGQPSSSSIRVAMDRLRHCPEQITSPSSQQRRKRGRPRKNKKQS